MPPKRCPRAEASKSSGLNQVVEKLTTIRGKLWVEKHRISAFDDKLLATQKALLDAKAEYLTLHKIADEKASTLQEIEKKALSCEANLRTYEALIAEFPSISNELDKFANENSASDYQEMLQNFVKQSNRSPWALEKRQYLNCLREDENQLEITKRLIAAVNQKIDKARKELEQHNEYSFRKFCLTLASFSHNHQSLRELLKKEEAINRDLKSRLPEVDDENISELGAWGDSFFCDRSLKSQNTSKNLTPEAQDPVPPSSRHPAETNRDETEEELHTEIIKPSAVPTAEDRDSLSLSSLEEEENEELFDTEEELFDAEEERGNLPKFVDKIGTKCAPILKPLDKVKNMHDGSFGSFNNSSSSNNFFANFNPTLNLTNDVNPFGF